MSRRWVKTLLSLCFLAVATVPLLNHLGHPERAINIVVTPNFSSAMAGFGILYTSYFITLQLTARIGWTIHLWAGVIILAGVIGLLLSYLTHPPVTPFSRRQG